VKLGGKARYVYKEANREQLLQIKKQLDDAGIKLSVLDTGIYKIPLPGTTPMGQNASDLNPGTGKYKEQMEDLKRAGEAAHTLGVQRLRIFTFTRVADPNTVFDRVVEEVQKAVAVAKEQDLTLLVENEFDTNVATGDETARFFKAITDRHLMHNCDPGNAYEAGEEQPYPQMWDKLDHSRISHIHLKDAVGKDWKPIGAGKIDFAGQFQALKKMQYSGTISLETHYRNAQKDPYTSSVEAMDGLVRILKQV